MSTRAEMDTATSSPGAPASRGQAFAAESVLRHLKNRSLVMTIIALALILYFWLSTPAFFTVGNLIDAASAYVFIAVVAVGMTYLFIAGEFDLSLGANYGFTAALVVFLILHSWNPWLACVVTIVVGGLIGLVNAFFTTIFRIPSFITTIGMLSVLQGLLLYVTGGLPLTIPAKQPHFLLSALGGSFGQAGAPDFWAIGILLVTGVILRFTPFGYHIYLTGGNPRAARQMGINVVGVKTWCFVLAGGLAGLAGVVGSYSLGSAQPSTGQGDFLFEATGAAIIGGVALAGGAGSIYGTLVGSVILATLSDGLALSNAGPAFVVIYTGALIIIAGAAGAGLHGLRDWLSVIRRRMHRLQVIVTESGHEIVTDRQ
jgi:ribose/xylose/arabinose/galactoside ABC-type transport system permease subunit